MSPCWLPKCKPIMMVHCIIATFFPSLQHASEFWTRWWPNMSWYSITAVNILFHTKLLLPSTQKPRSLNTPSIGALYTHIIMFSSELSQLSANFLSVSIISNPYMDQDQSRLGFIKTTVGHLSCNKHQHPTSTTSNCVNIYNRNSAIVGLKLLGKKLRVILIN